MMRILSNLKSQLRFLPLFITIGWIIIIFSFGQDSHVANLIILIFLFLLAVAISHWHYLLNKPSKALTFSILICLFLAYFGETTLYVTKPERYLPKNGTFNDVQYTWGHEIVNNSLGFREKEIIIPKPVDVFRVMVLGDSITWGAGVSVSDRFTGILQETLSKTPSTQNIEILNFADGGGSTTQQLDVLRQNINLVNPDVIVVGFNENDPEMGRPEVQASRQSIQNLFEPIEKYSHRFFLTQSLSTTRHASLHILESLGYLPPLSKTAISYSNESAEWKKFKLALSNIKELSDSHYLPPPIFMGLNIGTYTDRPTNYLKPDLLLKKSLLHFDQALNTASNIGFTAIDNRKEIAAQLPNQNLSINPFDRHPAPALHKIYAEKLYQILLSYVEFNHLIQVN